LRKSLEYQRYIEVYICIVFGAYEINKELKLQLKEEFSALNVQKAIDIFITIYVFK
jgi:hypothetical protein